MNNSITSIEQNKIDFIGINKRLFSSKKHDVITILKQFIFKKKHSLKN